MMEIRGLCIACAHYKYLGIWMRDGRGQTPNDPVGLCYACRDACEPLRGPCSSRCFCSAMRQAGIAEVKP